MSDNRSLQKANQGQRAGAIMTPQGPAIIQVIDIPAGPLGYAGAGMGGGAGRKPGGINILGAILRRWWLVLIVTILIGGGGIYAGNNFVKPVYIAHAKVSWIDRSGSPDGQGTSRLISQATDVLVGREIPILAARDPEMPSWVVNGRDLDDPAVQADVIKKLKEVATADSSKFFQTVDLQITRTDRVEAARMANAFARGFVQWCQNQLKGDLDMQIAQLKQSLDETQALKAALNKEKTILMVDNKIDQGAQELAVAMGQASDLMKQQLDAKVQLAAADNNLKMMENSGVRRPEQELIALDLVETEQGKDNILQTYNAELVRALSELESDKATMTAVHPKVRQDTDHVAYLKAEVEKRRTEISSIIRDRINSRFKLMDLKTVAEAKAAVDKAQELLGIYNTRLSELDKRAKELVYVKGQIQALDDRIALVSREFDASFSALEDQKKLLFTITNNSGIKIAEYAVPPEIPNADQRVKVQAAGMVGGLFLGMLLALLVDKFDKRLRDPRDVEPLLGAPLLGTIPRIGELKRIKGEHARNLIAEEFRIIRTQLLFGNPELNYKVIAITSPQPGDGKTSLAVNLAISIAKAGRRVLLIDSDLRKPDIHRIFNIPDSPGFSEVIAGSHEPGAVIRKSDIDGLDVLPAGTPITRPSELLSRPEVGRVLAALGEIYDHIILDTAPLLPVSDTHVLVGLVDGVLTSFNAEVDRNTVTVVQEILRRCRANVIGTVMNQVKYKQSGSFQRGKAAYSSYYTSTRVPPASKTQGKADPNVATLTKSQ
jgi:capsular exopolysaccharide synthesis family protein